MNETYGLGSTRTSDVLAIAGGAWWTPAAMLRHGDMDCPSDRLRAMRQASISNGDDRPDEQLRQVHPEIVALIGRLGHEFVLAQLCTHFGRDELMRHLPPAKRGAKPKDDTWILEAMADEMAAAGKQIQPHTIAKRLLHERNSNLEGQALTSGAARIVGKFKEQQPSLVAAAQRRRRLPKKLTMDRRFRKAAEIGASRSFVPAQISQFQPMTIPVRFSHDSGQYPPLS